jgi:hypothetical protein
MSAAPTRPPAPEPHRLFKALAAHVEQDGVPFALIETTGKKQLGLTMNDLHQLTRSLNELIASPALSPDERRELLDQRNVVRAGAILINHRYPKVAIPALMLEPVPAPPQGEQAEQIRTQARQEADLLIARISQPGWRHNPS